MIELNELRLNNLVDVNGLCLQNGICKVAEILADCVTVEYAPKSYQVALDEDIFPIPLTRDILEQNGFNYLPLHIPDAWSNGKVKLKQHPEGFRVSSGYFKGMVTSVHELQNLYFAIYKEELNFNL